MTSLAIDLSTELAEDFALPPAGIPLKTLQTLTIGPDGRKFHPRHGMPRFDAELLPLISSAHLCCGAHSGDPAVLARLVPTLLEHDIQLGAHPSYPDIFSFGQYRVDLSHDELVATLLFQFGALQAVLKRFGAKIQHVKCHGALAFDVAYLEPPCAALIEAMQCFDPALVMVAMAGSPSVNHGRAAGITVIEEGFADRGYASNGQLVPRDHPKALLTESTAIAAQVLAMARGTGLQTVDGKIIDLPARTFCLHSDTPAAGKFAARLKRELEVRSIAIRPIAELVG